METGIIGTSIWQQNTRLLERLTIDREDRTEQLRHLKRALGADELIYLATCNRVEFIYARTQSTESRPLHRLIDFFFRSGRGRVSFFPNDFYSYSGRDAVRHLFRTVASLDSLVLGETQIAGQFKDAWSDAGSAGLSGPTLDSLAAEALQVSRRVRQETRLGDGSLSMASLACRELKSALTADGDSRIALVGAGPMTHKLAKYIREAGLGRLLFVNRTFARAQSLADEFDGMVMSLDAFLASPSPVEAIISATASTTSVFDRAFLDRLPSSGKPVLCVDLALPRDFSAEFADNPRTTLVDIPLLKSREQHNLRRKFTESARADEIVGDAVARFLRHRLEDSIKPILSDSYHRSLALAERALDDLFAGKLNHLGEHERQAVRSLVGKLVGHSSYGPGRALSDRLLSLQDAVFFDIFDENRKKTG